MLAWLKNVLTSTHANSISSPPLFTQCVADAVVHKEINFLFEGSFFRNMYSQIWPPQEANFLNLWQWQKLELVLVENLRDNKLSSSLAPHHYPPNTQLMRQKMAIFLPDGGLTSPC